MFRLESDCVLFDFSSRMNMFVIGIYRGHVVLKEGESKTESGRCIQANKNKTVNEVYVQKLR